MDVASELELPLVLSEEVSLVDEALSVPIRGELGNTTEGSVVMVFIESGCKLAV